MSSDCRWRRFATRVALRFSNKHPESIANLGKNIVERIREPLADSLVERCA